MGQGRPLKTINHRNAKSIGKSTRIITLCAVLRGSALSSQYVSCAAYVPVFAITFLVAVLRHITIIVPVLTSIQKGVAILAVLSSLHHTVKKHLR